MAKAKPTQAQIENTYAYQHYLDRFTLLALSMALALCACGSKGSDTIKGTYSMHVGGYDWGCATDKVILSLDYALDAVAIEDFVVEETKNMTNWGQNPDVAFGEAYEGTTTLKVTKAYLCDETGAETTEPSKNVALEIYVDGEQIILKKYEPACIFCGDARDVANYKGKNICQNCLGELKTDK